MLTLVGGALRFYHAESRQFWGDEVHTYQVANEPATLATFWQTWWDTKQMSDPPLYYFLSWLNVRGSDDFGHLRLRLFSIVFGILCIPLTYRLFKLLGNGALGMFGAFLMAFSTFAIQYSQEYRPYSLLLLASLLLYDALLRFSSRVSRATWLCLLGSTLFIIYSHYFGGFALVVGYAIAGFVVLKWQPGISLQCKWAALLSIPVISAILYLPVIIHAPAVVQATAPVLNPESFDATLFKATAENVRYAYAQLKAFASWRLGGMPLWAESFVFVLAGLGLVRSAWQNLRIFLTVMLWVLGTTILSFAFYDLAHFPYDARRNIFQLPAFLFFVAHGILLPSDVTALLPVKSIRLPWLRHLPTAALAGIMFWISWGNYVEYDARGWRNEYRQSDWRGMAEYVGRMAETRDVAAVPVIDNTWLRLHYLFYHQQFAKTIPCAYPGSVEDLQNLSAEGERAWFVLGAPWEIPKDLFEYLVSNGQWRCFFGGAVVFLPPQAKSSSSEEWPEYLLSRKRAVAVLGPKRGVANCDLILTHPLQARLSVDSGAGLPRLLLDEGVQEMIVHNRSTTSPPTTITLYRQLQPGEWWSAVDFDEIKPNSMMIRPCLKDGELVMWMQHNGVLYYRFDWETEGSYDLFVEAKNDKPGPIKIRVFTTSGAESEPLLFNARNNQYSVARTRINFRRGINVLTLYYCSFERTKEEQREYEDNFNAFEVLRWKLEPADETQ